MNAEKCNVDNGQCASQIDLIQDSYESRSNFYPENENEITLNEKDYNNSVEEVIFCGCCESAFKIKFKSKTKLNIKCEKAWKILETSDLIKSYIKYRDKINDLRNLICIFHNNKYQRFCTNCKINLCVDCIIENNCQGNNHTVISLEAEEVNELKNYIKNNYNLKENNKEEQNFCYLLKTLVSTHEKYPNIKTYKSILSAFKLIELLKKGKNENEKIEKLKEGKFIKDLNDLRKKRGKSDKFFNINLNNMAFKNLKFLSKYFLKDNSKLLKLTLAGNNLTNIKFITYAKMDNLILLDLSRNKLGNRNIKHISSLQCPKLEEFYLHQNMFNDYTLFNTISKKFNLIVFYIGFNKFEKNFDKIEACKFPNLNEVGINFNFNNETFEKFVGFEMPNLEYLFIQNNDINSLAFLEKMNIPKLKMLYVNRNKLKEIDIDVLTKFNNLETVNFDLNSIDDIDNIEKIKYLKQLKLFSIKNNKLDNKDKKILEDIKKENEKLKLEL